MTAHVDQLSSGENFKQSTQFTAVHVDLMYRATYVHSFSISNEIIEIARIVQVAGPSLISLVADCCLSSGEST